MIIFWRVTNINDIYFLHVGASSGCYISFLWIDLKLQLCIRFNHNKISVWKISLITAKHCHCSCFLLKILVINIHCNWFYIAVGWVDSVEPRLIGSGSQVRITLRGKGNYVSSIISYTLNWTIQRMVEIPWMVEFSDLI